MFLAFITPQVIGLAAGICTSTSLLPQLIKVLKEKKAEDISVPMLFTLLAGLALWIYYGIIKEDWPIILTNCFSLILNIGLIIVKFKYSRTPASQN